MNSRHDSRSASRSPRHHISALAIVALTLAAWAPRAAAQGRWTTETRLPKATQEISVAGFNGLVYVAAGSLNQVRTNAVWSYDPAAKTWTSLAPYPGTARDHAALVATTTALYLIGGVTAWPQPSVASVHRYDPATNSWTSVASLPVARGAAGAAVLNGRIYVAGGLEAGVSVADFTVYDPATNTWTTLPSMPTARDHLTAAALNGKLYAIGGRINGQTCSPMNIVEVYDPATNAWSTGVPMQGGHAGHATGFVNGHIQVFGGEGNASNCGTIAASEDFDPSTNTWTALPNMPTPRHGIAGATVGSNVYLPGGATWTGDAATPAHERYDSTGTPTSGPVPSPWTDLDVGNVGLAGASLYDTGIFTIQAAGANIWGTADSFRFVYQPLSGDGQIVARVESLGYTASHAKAGVMIRETLSAGSRHVVLDSQPDNTTEFMVRSATGGTTVKLAGSTTPEPVWLKLTRSGSTIAASVSADGSAWTSLGTTTVSLPTTVYVGLAVSSHLTTKLTSATIDHVTVSSGGVNAAPTVTLTSPTEGSVFTAPATVALGANASDSDGSVARVDFFANNTQVASVTSAPFTASWANVAAGTYTMTAVATDNGGAQTTSAPVGITVSAAPSGDLPAPWQHADIGAVGAAGSAAFDGTTFTVKGAGADIWGTTDAFQYAYQPLNGDGQIVARVASVQNVYQWTKAGVMIRNTLDASSAYAYMLVSAAKGLAFQSRTSAGASATSIAGAAAAAPYWVKVVRSGGTLTGYQSADGTTWTKVGSANLSLGASVYVGLAVTSHNTSTTATAAFDGVAVSAAAPPSNTLPSPWVDTDIGSVGLKGSAAYGTGVFTIRAAGANIWSSADSFNFVNQVLTGDSQIVARVTGLQNTDTHAKAGVMLRESLASNSRDVILDVEPSGRIEFMRRDATGGTTAVIANSAVSFPVWLRLTRTSSTVLAALSADGFSWTQVGSTTTSIPAAAYHGLAVTSHNTSVLTTATIDNVSASSTGSTSNAPPTVSLTSPSAGAVFVAPANISLAASANDSDGTVVRVDFVANNTIVASATTSPFTGSWLNVGAGSYTLTAIATDDDGAQTTSAPASITVTSGTTTSPTLPSPWIDSDVGSVGVSGSATWDSGVFTVKGAGADIWGTVDSFNYVNQVLSGNSQIIARVTSLQNTDLHAKAGVMLREDLATNAKDILLDIEPSGRVEFSARSSSGGTTALVVAATSHAFPVWLKLTRTSGSGITASMSSDGASWTTVGSTTTAISSMAYLGMAVTSHNTTALTTATFDNVSTLGTPPPPPPSGTISFTKKTLAVGGTTATSPAAPVPNLSSPTSLALGPDGKLYVSGVTGRIFILTLDPTKLADPNQIAVTHTQELDDIYLKPSIVCDSNGLNCTQQPPPGNGRQVTGIAIDPASTAANIILYVSHSGLSFLKTDMTLYPFGGAITRLTLRPDPAGSADVMVAEDQDLVVGLPRSREAHTPNGMDFGADGWLYLAIGGDTNAGAPSTFFANLPEHYLSASVVRLNLKNLLGVTLPIDVTEVNASGMTTWAGKFEQYATGYRNPYDIAWHSNGRLYLNGNAPNLNQGLTPGSADGCPTPSIDVGTVPDTLNVVTQGAYGGHPNPSHHQCVWGDGTAYSPALTPEAGWVKPIWKYSSPSANGIVEYKSNAFNGAMKGNLLSAVYAGEQVLQRVVLNADGSGVSSVSTLATFSHPLDVIADLNGVIYVNEYGANAITLLIPTVMGSCPVPGSDPTITDSDGDGYTDYDETANGTDPCSAASTPADFNQNHVSDLFDNDDDSDGIADASDQLFFDAQNGAATALPVALEWNPSDPAYGKVASTGFTGVQISTNGPVDQASGHALVTGGIHAGDAGGHLTMWTYAGTAEGAANNQANALDIGFDSTSDFRVWSRVTQPFTGVIPALGHVGGIFFGPGEDDYVRLALVGTAAGGEAVQVAVEVNGVFTEVGRVDVTGTSIANLDLFLIGRPGSRTVTAYYDLNTTGVMTPIGAPIAVPAAWFSNNTGSGANTSVAGLMGSNGTAAQMAFIYDFFRIDRNVP